ncbi:uncharacterized protein LOC129297461 [Prosopis cineraria]|uniref:uncharacterized protein LOC129297461 n=1 Tax=Prosopis cineraria TaxID=364024 RepID=UPI0024109442|nr:uncharacterized protein LOC129297461 [Prosopis cineraria]
MMQSVSVLPSSSTFTDSSSSTIHDEISGDFAENMRAKLKIDDVIHEGEQEQEDEEEEFSFACMIPDGSPISAGDVFENGQIRPMYPIFDTSLLFSEEYEGSSTPRPPLKKVFVEQRGQVSSSSSSESEEPDGPPEGSYCVWSGKMAVEASSAKCNKSNSTGFSKLWRFRETKLRSNSDGKDAFVFLNPSDSKSTANPKSSGAQSEKVATMKASSGEAKNVVVKKVKGGNSKTTSSAHEKHYVMSRAKKESDKRKSYLPYRQGLVGIFANVNGLSRNVHPF